MGSTQAARGSSWASQQTGGPGAAHVGDLPFVMLLVPVEGVRLCGFLGGKGVNSQQWTGTVEGGSYQLQASTYPKLYLPLRLWVRVCGLVGKLQIFLVSHNGLRFL